MSAWTETRLFKASLYGMIALQVVLIYIGWGEWSVPPYLRLAVTWPAPLSITLPQAAGFVLVGIEAFGLVQRDRAKDAGSPGKARVIVAGWIIVFALNGFVDVGGWYSIFGRDSSARTESAEDYSLNREQQEDSEREAKAIIARIQREGIPRAEAVIAADFAHQNELDRRWRNQYGNPLPKKYVDDRAVLEVEQKTAAELASAKKKRDDARDAIRNLGAAPHEASPMLAALNGLGISIDAKQLNAIAAFGLMVAMKFWIGLGFWATTHRKEEPAAPPAWWRAFQDFRARRAPALPPRQEEPRIETIVIDDPPMLEAPERPKRSRRAAKPKSADAPPPPPKVISLQDIRRKVNKMSRR